MQTKTQKTPKKCITEITINEPELCKKTLTSCLHLVCKIITTQWYAGIWDPEQRIFEQKTYNQFPYLVQ